jgi:single-strand DNA-binding protein
VKGPAVANFNRLIIIGNLTRDPELKQLPSGQGLCKFGIASNRQFRNKATGTLTQEVCFVDIDVWGPQAESCKQYLQKGRPVLVEGRLKFESWKDNEGHTRSKHSVVAERVVFLGSRQDAEAGVPYETGLGSARAAEQEGPSFASAENTNEVKFMEENAFTDDLPF